ncbi:SDR family oxidoreductase [Pedobacter metabolipauper]|uniref:Uncharacterized protein YbjT (DUF2867 family) n=1 Tax=Pedobacter metabolipauper TaxID=425513 RepID=A0A4R6SRI4_9SPHI|nr:SDR family oxidoreductase [Pedobacter metabolipauper]TDQ06222.1 uncharacterized protein YbjT (DUF2867 family) [Pedobacter metabolipauper]
MKIVVIGGSGLIGTKLVKSLRTLGHEVIAASPKSGVDTITGAGLADALKGAEIVVDVANSPSFEDAAVLAFFETSGKNLLAAEAIAGVKHHIALSVVGTERLQESGYFRAKLAQEKLIKASAIPYTIVHATQFFEFVSGIVQAGTKDDTIVMSTAMVQPIASDDVVAKMTEITLGNPLNATVEVAGPELFRLNDLVKKYMLLKQDEREVVSDRDAPYYGAKLETHSLIPGEAASIGKIPYDSWINEPGNLK